MSVAFVRFEQIQMRTLVGPGVESNIVSLQHSSLYVTRACRALSFSLVPDAGSTPPGAPTPVMSESESAPHTSPVATPMRGSMVICKERLKEILVAPRVFEVCIRLDRRVSTYTLGLVFRRWPGACTQCERVDVHIRIHTLCGWPANTHTTQIITDLKQERLKIKTAAP